MASPIIKYTVFWQRYLMQTFLTHNVETPFLLSKVFSLSVRPLQTEYNRREAVRENMDATQLWILLFSYLVAFLMPLCTIILYLL